MFVLAAIAIVAAFTFRDYGLGWDDYTHAQYGELLVQYYASGFADKRALSFVNLYMYGGGFDVAAALLDRITPFDLFETRRFLGAVVGIIGIVFTWRLARRVGSPLAGLLALVLLATCPLFYGHMFMNPKDAPFAVAMIVLLYGIVRVLEDYPAPRLPTVVIFGVGLGLAVGSRILAGFAVLAALAPFGMLLMDTARQKDAIVAAREFGRMLLRLLPGIVLAYVVMGLVWPWAVVDPLNPIRALGYFSEFFEKPWKELFEGSLIAVPEMPRSYIPVNLALRMPEVFLLLSSGGIAFALATTIDRHVPLRRRAILALILLAAVLPLAVAIATRPAMYNGLRHFIFVAPPLAVLGGLASAWLLGRLMGLSRAAAVAGTALLLAGFSLPVWEFYRLHPYQYAHFNRLAGGVKAADNRFMLDYWGLALKQGAEDLREALTARAEVPPKGRWRIAVCGPHPPAEVELGPKFVTTWDPKGADFALMLGEFYCANIDAPVLVEVKREDVIFARVYDIRGRKVESLFTVPPVR